MLDLVSLDRSFYLKRQDSFTNPIGGILTIIIILLSLSIFYINGVFLPTSIIASTEYNLSADEIKTIIPPEMKIIYGFPSNISNNLDVIIQKDGERNIISLLNYTDEMWNQYFNYSKNPNYVYKYHYWQNTSFIQVIDRTIVDNSLFKPTDFYCIDKTQIETPIRLNEYGDLECFGTDEINCEWNIDTIDKCETLLRKELKNLNPLSCGIQHLKLWAMDGYSSPTHWCNIGRKLLLKLNPEAVFASWDNELLGKKIFMALEETKYNDKTNELENGYIKFSDENDPYNYIIALRRKVSRVKINKGFFRLESEFKYSNYLKFETKLIRKLPKNVYFHYNIVDNDEENIEKKSKEITFELTLDLIAKNFSLITPIIFFFYVVNIFFNDYIFCKFILSNYRPLKKKKKYSSYEKIIIEYNKNDFNFINYLKYFVLFWKRKNNLTIQNFDKLYNSILELISIESLYGEEIKMKSEDKSRFYNFLLKLDLLAPKRDLFINQNTKFETELGRLLTKCLFLFVIFILYYLGIDFFKSSQPLKIIFTQETSYIVDYTLLYKTIPIMIYYPAWIDPYLKFIYNNRSIDELNYNIIPDYMMPNFCTNEEIKNFNVSRNDSFVYYCSDALNFIDPLKKNDNKIKFGLGKCNNITKFNNSIKNCENSQYENKEFSINLAIKSWKTDEDSEKNEYKKEEIIINSYPNNFINNQKNYTLFYNSLINYNWTEDDSPFLSSELYECFHTVNDNEITTPQYLSEDNTFIISIFSISLDNKIKNVKRSYAKLLILLNKVYLCSSIFLYLLYVIYYNFGDYFFMRTFSDFYFNKESRSMSKTIRSLRFLKMIGSERSNPEIKHEIQSKIFTFGHHLKFLFYSRHNPDVRKYKVIQDELLNSLSFERIALNNEKSVKIGFFEKFDFLTNNRLFLLNKKSTFQTAIGGIITIIFVIMCIMFAIFMGQEYYYNKNPKVRITSLYYSEKNLDYWPQQILPIMLYITNVVDYPSYFVLNDQITETISLIKDDSCSEEIFKTFNIEKNPKYKYGCADIYGIMGENHKLKKNNKYISFGITTCQEWSTFKIFEYQDNPKSFVTHPCPSETVKTGEKIEAGAIIKFNDFEKDFPGLINTLIHEKTNNTQDLYSLKFDISGNQLEDDMNSFFKQFQSTFFTSLVSLSKQNFVGFNNGLFGSLSVSIYQNEDHYTLYQRNYLKFMDYFVNLYTIILILFQISKLISKYLNNFFFLQYYQKFYLEIHKAKEMNRNPIRSDLNFSENHSYQVSISPKHERELGKINFSGKHLSLELAQTMNEAKQTINLKKIENDTSENQKKEESFNKVVINKLTQLEGDKISLKSIAIDQEIPEGISHNISEIKEKNRLSRKSVPKIIDYNYNLQFKEFLSAKLLFFLYNKNRKFNETISRLIRFYSLETLYKKTLKKSDLDI